MSRPKTLRTYLCASSSPFKGMPFAPTRLSATAFNVRHLTPPGSRRCASSCAALLNTMYVTPAWPISKRRFATSSIVVVFPVPAAAVTRTISPPRGTSPGAFAASTTAICSLVGFTPRRAVARSSTGISSTSLESEVRSSKATALGEGGPRTGVVTGVVNGGARDVGERRLVEACACGGAPRGRGPPGSASALRFAALCSVASISPAGGSQQQPRAREMSASATFLHCFSHHHLRFSARGTKRLSKISLFTRDRAEEGSGRERAWPPRRCSVCTARCRRARAGSPTTTSESASRPASRSATAPISPRASTWASDPPSTLTAADRTPAPRTRYVRRKVREEFHKNAGLAGEEAAAAIAKAKAERALIDRQVAVYDMFGSKTPSVIDFAKTRK